MIRLKDVTVSYVDHIALKSVSLHIKKGDHLAVIGPNGAGKTSLLTAINGLGDVRQGRVMVKGEVINKRNIRKIQRISGYVPQNMNIDPRAPVSVFDVVMMGRIGKIGLFRSPGKKDADIVKSALELCGIEELALRPVGRLSGGERQKVFIARAMAQEPEILLLDEPTTSLDLRAQKEIVSLIDSIYARQKLTVVFVTHILKNIPLTCNTCCLIKDGHIVFFGNRKDALKTERLTELYGCEIALASGLSYV
ncbi:MAG: ABC transporter ATP-binding protein [Candidatus Aureabacteria bacterium]|nr:ABC transporter ATP-binding protein [Candidatus Auribacterota bacterium]